MRRVEMFVVDCPNCNALHPVQKDGLVPCDKATSGEPITVRMRPVIRCIADDPPEKEIQG